MINFENLMTLIKTAANPTPGINFSDANSAAINALLEYVGLDKTNLTPKIIHRHAEEIFSIIEEAVDIIVPQRLEAELPFAEIRQFARDEEVKFTIRNLGRNRVVYGIVPGARGGVYRAHRLDDTNFTITTSVKTVGYQITLEELLTGSRSVADLVSIITDGFKELLYIDVIKALRGTYATLPAANKAEASGGAIDYSGLDKVIRVVRQYGNPVIFGFSTMVDKILNAVGTPTNYNPNISTADIEDIRKNGRVSVYKSTPIVVLPNYLIDNTNSKWYFKENDMFILPSDAKPVKVAFKGETYTEEVHQVTGGQEWHAHKLVGVGLVFNNHIGIYHDTTDDANGIN